MPSETTIEARSRLETLYRESSRTLVYAGACSFAVNMLMLAGPIYMLQVYDRVLVSGSVPTLVALTILIMGLFIVLGLVEWVRRGLFSATASQLEELLANDSLSASIEAKLSDAGQSPRQPLNDLSTVRRFLSGSALPALFDLPWIPLFFLALFYIHWMYGALGLLGAGILVGLAILNQRVSQSALSRTSTETKNTSLLAEEITNNAETMTALGMRNSLQARWRDHLDSADSSAAKSNRVLTGFSSGTRASRLFLQSSILGLGAWLAIIGQSTPGAMIAASIILSRAVAPIDQIVGQWQAIFAARDAWRSLSDVLRSRDEPIERITLPPIQGAVSVDNLSLYRAGREAPILNGVSFELSVGETLGIIGPSASGKSSLARVLTGVWEATTGEVRIDGAHVSAWASDELGRQMGYVGQEPGLFLGSIKENISRFTEDPSAEAIVSAAQIAGCHEMILGLDDGYETQIGRGATFLSGGQKQLIGLARAMFGNPNVIILDEPNSNLDASGDHALRQALVKLKSRRATTIIISHRPGVLQACDKILALDKGSVSLFGDRDTVLSKLAEASKSTRVTPIRKGSDGV